MNRSGEVKTSSLTPGLFTGGDNGDEVIEDDDDDAEFLEVNMSVERYCRGGERMDGGDDSTRFIVASVRFE